MPITVNEGGTKYQLEKVIANESGTRYEMDRVVSNEGGTRYEIHSSKKYPKKLTWESYPTGSSTEPLLSESADGLEIACKGTTTTYTSNTKQSNVFETAGDVTLAFSFIRGNGFETSSGGFTVYQKQEDGKFTQYYNLSAEASVTYSETVSLTKGEYFLTVGANGGGRYSSGTLSFHLQLSFS